MSVLKLDCGCGCPHCCQRRWRVWWKVEYMTKPRGTLHRNPPKLTTVGNSEVGENKDYIIGKALGTAMVAAERHGLEDFNITITVERVIK